MKLLRSQPNALAGLADARETTDTRGALVIAVGGRSAREVCAMSAPLARDLATAVHVLQVVERDIESSPGAHELLNGCVAELREAGVPVAGELLHVTGTHAAVAARILERAAQLSATAIVLGPQTRRGPFGARVNAMIAGSAPTHVLILNPAAGPFRQIDEHPRTIAPAQLWRTLDLVPNGLAA